MRSFIVAYVKHYACIIVANVQSFLTLSSTAIFLDFHTNSNTATTQATPIPPINTTNTPPTLARPSSLAALLVFEVSS